MAHDNNPAGTGVTHLESMSRRQALLLLGAVGAAGTVLKSVVAEAAKPVRTAARIVIAGAAGLSMASRLAEALDGAKITLIDARKEHFYQPGFLLIGSWIKPESYVVSTTAEYVPKRMPVHKPCPLQENPSHAVFTHH